MIEWFISSWLTLSTIGFYFYIVVLILLSLFDIFKSFLHDDSTNDFLIYLDTEVYKDNMKKFKLLCKISIIVFSIIGSITFPNIMLFLFLL